MKKLKAIILALAMLTAVSCSAGKSSEPAPSEQAAETVTVTQTAYMETRIHLDHEITKPVTINVIGSDTHFFYISGQELRHAVVSGENSLVSDDCIGNVFDTNIGCSVCMYEDGSFCTICPQTDFPFEYNEYGSITNYGDFVINGDFTFIFADFDSSGKKVSETELIGMRKDFDKSQSRLGGMFPYGSDRLILTAGNCLMLIGTDGTYIEGEHHEMQRYDLGVDCDGNVIISSGFNNGYMDGETLRIPDKLYDDPEDIRRAESSFVSGTGGFKSYVSYQDGIYGYTAGGEEMLVFDFSSSFVNSGELTVFAARGDGEFIGAGYDSSDICLYTRRADDYSSERVEINVWQISGGTSDEDATAFNKMSDKYTVKFRSTLASPDELTKAILVDEGPDVIRSNGSSTTMNMINLGALADMYPLMDSCDYIKRDDLMPNVLAAYDMDGKLYALPEVFDIRCIAANREVMGDLDNTWTFDDFIDIYHNAPAGTLLWAGEYNTSFSMLVRSAQDAWIDWENCTTRFNTPEFVRVLEFCKETNDSKYPMNFDIDEVEYVENLNKKLTCLKDKTALFDSFDLMWAGGIDSVADSISGKGIDMGEAVLMNIPETGTAGSVIMHDSFSILENSKCKEGAWAFISYILSEERPANWDNALNYTNRHVFEDKLNKFVENYSEPKKQTYGVGLMSGENVTLEYDMHITPQQAEDYKKMVLNSTKLAFTDNGVDKILYEEFDRFMNDETTAEQCAEYIANRVDILISEKS